jgi:hypothetical protein
MELQFLEFFLCGLVVGVLALDPRFAGSNPAEGDGFLKGYKNLRHTFLQRGRKAGGPMS